MKRLPILQTTETGPARWSDIRQAGLWLAFAAWLTVRNCASTISSKLQVADRAQAMDVARRKGLG